MLLRLSRRIEHGGGGFRASPVAADDMIFLPNEDGEIFVVKAGTEFQLMATNHMGEVLMATPALSEGTMYVRGRHHVFAIGNPRSKVIPSERSQPIPPMVTVSSSDLFGAVDSTCLISRRCLMMPRCWTFYACPPRPPRPSFNSMKN